MSVIPFSLLLLLGICLVLIYTPSFTQASVLNLYNDRRALIHLLQFGFAPGGSFNVTLNQFTISNIDGPSDKFIGLYILRTDTINTPLNKDTNHDELTCPTKWNLPDDMTTFIDLRNVGPTFHYVHHVVQLDAALWSTYILNCNVWGLDFDGNGAMNGPAISTSIEYTAINPPNSLLDVGLQPLPYIYLLFSIIYTIIMLLYIRILYQSETQVFWIHRLMLLLLICTIFDKSFHSIQTWYLSNGTDVKAWDFAAYILTFIKSSLAMTIVALIASGWSFVRPILPKRERNIVLCIIPLQILTNLARFMMNTIVIGSINWNSWGNLFSVFDLLSFLMIFWTILSTRAHLMKFTHTEGKAKETLNRIKLWGTLYALVLGYMYLTRIIAVLLTVVLPFTHLWIADTFIELVGVWFYSVIGYKFRPMTENPYMQLMTITDDDDIENQIKDEEDNGTALELDHL